MEKKIGEMVGIMCLPPLCLNKHTMRILMETETARALPQISSDIYL